MNNKKTSYYFKRLYPYIKHRKGALIIIVLLTSLNIIFPLILTYLDLNILNAFTEELFKDLYLLFAISISIGIIWSVIKYIKSRLNVLLSNELSTNLKNETLDKINKLKITEFDNKGTGAFVNRLTNDIENVPRKIEPTLNQFVTILESIVFLFAVYILNIFIGIYFTFMIFIKYLFIQYSSKVSRNMLREIEKELDENTSIITEYIHGIRDVFKLNLTDTLKTKIMTKNKNIVDFRKRRTNKIATVDLIGSIIENIMYLILFYMLAYFTSNLFISIGLGIMIYTYNYKVTLLLDKYYTFIHNLDYLKIALDRIFDIIDNDSFQQDSFGELQLSNPKGKIEFNNVSFGYKDELVLKELNFTIEPYDTVALVGKSGGGKSTIFNLLTKTYETNSGEVMIDGFNVLDLTKDSLRNTISIITQDPYIFNLSIRDNLKLVKEDLTEDDMIKYCKMSAIHEFIETLPQKYDTLVGEGGVNLSGGQKQRLAIARTLIKDCKILLFDEATSALDNETQKKITQTINNISDDYTIIIIAHRLSTIKECKRILFIDNGKIIASGTHDELLNSCNEYKELYSTELLSKK